MDSRELDKLDALLARLNAHSEEGAERYARIEGNLKALCTQVERINGTVKDNRVAIVRHDLEIQEQRVSRKVIIGLAVFMIPVMLTIGGMVIAIFALLNK